LENVCLRRWGYSWSEPREPTVGYQWSYDPYLVRRISSAYPNIFRALLKMFR
jgi:hypothetical protein